MQLPFRWFHSVAITSPISTSNALVGKLPIVFVTSQTLVPSHSAQRTSTGLLASYEVNVVHTGASPSSFFSQPMASQVSLPSPRSKPILVFRRVYDFLEECYRCATAPWTPRSGADKVLTDGLLCPRLQEYSVPHGRLVTSTRPSDNHGSHDLLSSLSSPPNTLRAAPSRRSCDHGSTNQRGHSPLVLTKPISASNVSLCTDRAHFIPSFRACCRA